MGKHQRVWQYHENDYRYKEKMYDWIKTLKMIEQKFWEQLHIKLLALLWTNVGCALHPRDS